LLIPLLFTAGCKKDNDNNETGAPIVFRVATFRAGIYDINQNPARIDTINIVFDQNKSNSDLIYSRLRPGVQQFTLLARKILQTEIAEIYIYADLGGLSVGSEP